MKFPPIIEEEETYVAMQETSAEDEHEPAPVNEERTIVLFMPLHYHQPPSGQLYVDRDLISGFNNRAHAVGVDLVTFDEALGTADFISLHMPLTPTTSKMLNDETFRKMKKRVRVVNVARGGVIDEDSESFRFWYRCSGCS
ncbi:uncharacterized protein LOC18022075 [Eutrema salsugineum]|uniref:uncharacterized protein LOC18022075 n=1 Tax=Eutrema salsugineum TaxID=72664 RepID=UPI000CED0880|nr:uncharacterized protein LOC18022075 [Eutrema salsugineum]